MITLYHAPRSRSSRFVWLLEELGQSCSSRRRSRSTIDAHIERLKARPAWSGWYVRPLRGSRRRLAGKRDSSPQHGPELVRRRPHCR